MIAIRWGLVGVALLLGACGERPPMQSTQQGYRGTGMVDIQNPRLVAARAAAQPIVDRIPEVTRGLPAIGRAALQRLHDEHA